MAARRRIVFDTDEVVLSLYFAAASGDVKQLKSLIQKGADVNSFIHDGSSGVNKIKKIFTIPDAHFPFRLEKNGGCLCQWGVSARGGRICQRGVCLPEGGVSGRGGCVWQRGVCLAEGGVSARGCLPGWGVSARRGVCAPIHTGIFPPP